MKQAQLRVGWVCRGASNPRGNSLDSSIGEVETEDWGVLASLSFIASQTRMDGAPSQKGSGTEDIAQLEGASRVNMKSRVVSPALCTPTGVAAHSGNPRREAGGVGVGLTPGR